MHYRRIAHQNFATLSPFEAHRSQSFAPRRFADLRSCPPMLSSAFAFQRIAIAWQFNALPLLGLAFRRHYSSEQCCRVPYRFKSKPSLIISIQIQAFAHHFSSIAVQVRAKPLQIKAVPKQFLGYAVLNNAQANPIIAFAIPCPSVSPQSNADALHYNAVPLLNKAEPLLSRAVPVLINP